MDCHENKKFRAGIVVLKRFPTGFKMLCLRIYGSYDLPKGGLEFNEDVFDGALRETEEECGIVDLDFEWGYETCQLRNVILFVASTKESPNIRPNPHTGEFEHHAARWLELDEAENNLHPYLRPCVSWVRKKIGAL